MDDVNRGALRIELRHLRYFVAVAEELSFTNAARRLNTSQPSLSQQIKHLEFELGTPLFFRTKREVKLTAAGESFLRDARHVLDQLREALDKATRYKNRVQEHLVIGTIPAAEFGFLLDFLPSFRLENRGVDVTLKSLSPTEQLDSLRTGHIDLAFIRAMPADLAELTALGLAFDRIASHKLVAVLPSTHPLAGTRRVSLKALAKEPLVAVSPDMASVLARFVAQAFEGCGIRPRIAHVADNILVNLSLIGVGAGVSLLPDYVRRIRPAGVSYVPLDRELMIDLYVVSPADPGAAAGRFITAARLVACEGVGKDAGTITEER